MHHTTTRLGALLAAPLLLTAALVAAAPAEARTLSAKRLLARLDVAPERGSASYDRVKFWHWVDADGDGCDTREEVLILESRTAAARDTSCRVTTGSWRSWYDRATWTDPSDVDIDHLVALKEAWESGARRWSTAKRTAFANDLGHPWALEAATDNVNQSKSDRDPAQWLPTYNRCKYAIHWVAVKYRWDLAVDRAEKRGLASILDGSCGAKPVRLPARGTTALAGGAATPGMGGASPTSSPSTTPTVSSTPTPTPTATASGSCAPGYSPCIPPYPPDLDCADVGGPIYVTGSDPHGLDRDGDGVACE